MIFDLHRHNSATGVHVSPHPDLPPPSSPHSFGLSRVPALSALLLASKLHWSSILHMLICFSVIPLLFLWLMDIDNLISGSSAFSKSSFYIWNFSVHLLLKPSLKDFEHYLASMGKTEGKRRGWQKMKWLDALVGWHHWFNGHKFEQTPGDSEGQGSLACCSPWGSQRVRHNWMTEQQCGLRYPSIECSHHSPSPSLYYCKALNNS